jgi:branched-subunit amino acid aminotransferase/4-amino-4-deoxychorismate lyase
VHVDDLPQFEACFLTGTARKVVPIRLIDQISYAADNELLKRVSRGYDRLVSSYLKERS